MPTETELRAACAELAEDTPDLGRVLAALDSRPHRKHRVLAPLVAAAVVIAVAVAVVLLGVMQPKHESATSPLDFARHACDSPTTPAFDTFTIGRMGRAESLDAHGYAGGTAVACAGYRSRLIQVRVPHGGTSAAVTLFAPNTVDQHLLANPRPVSGSGISGYAGTLRVDPTKLCSRATLTSTSMTTLACNSPALMWQYAPNAWGMVQIPQAPSIFLLDVAAAVHPDSAALHFPGLIRGVDPALRPVHVAVQSVVVIGLAAPAQLGGDTGVHSGTVAYRTAAQATRCTHECAPALTISIKPGDARGQFDLVHGQHLTYRHRQLLITGTPEHATAVLATEHGCTLTIHADATIVPRDELIAIAEQTQFARNCTNPNTWPTIHAALGS